MVITLWDRAESATAAAEKLGTWLEERLDGVVGVEHHGGHLAVAIRR